MQTTRDQVQAYRFERRRAVAALLTGEPNAGYAPIRRVTVSTLTAVVLALALAAGSVAYGLVRPGADGGWRAAGVVVVENETAATYVRLDGVLHPVVNWLSAVLAVSDGRPPRVVHVDRAVLDGQQLGAVIGIPGLPVSVPAARQLTRAPVSVCSRPRTAAGAAAATVSLTIGDHAGATPLPGAAAILVRAAGTGTLHLLAGGRRFGVASPVVARSLQLDTSQALTVGAAFLDALPTGPALRTPTVAAAGTPYRAPIAGRPVAVGRLLHDADDDRDLVVLPDGVADLTPVQSRLLQTVRVPPQDTLAAPVQVSRRDVLDLPQSTAAWAALRRQLAGLPHRVPRTTGVPGRRGLCATYRTPTDAPVLGVPADDARLDQSAPQPPGSRSGLADRVTVERGGAALVRSSAHPQAAFLVAGPGCRYPTTSTVLGALGYAHARPLTLPARLLALIPVGAALDPRDARAPVTA